MSISSVKTPNQISQDIIVMQSYLQKYQQILSKYQSIRSDTIRAKHFFEKLVNQIEQSITQIALFTLISKYQDDRTQYRFYQLLDNIIESLQEFYTRYQTEYSRVLFDISEFIHTCMADRCFVQLNGLFTQASAIAAHTIIQELE